MCNVIVFGARFAVTVLVLNYSQQVASLMSRVSDCCCHHIEQNRFS